MSVLSRQQSMMVVEGNPLDSSQTPKSPMAGVKNEALSAANPISNTELDQLIKKLSNIEKNEEILRIVDETRIPYLFSSDNLIKLLEVTTSLKTKIAIIGLIGPRLMDPKAKIAYFTGLFRFVEDKNTVEEILKTRAQTINSSVFSRSENLKGAGGRGIGRSSITSRSGRGSMRSGLSPMGGSSSSLTPTKSVDNLHDSAQPVVSGFDNVLSALDDLGSDKITPSNKVSTESPKHLDDENVTETSSRNSSLYSLKDHDNNSFCDGKTDTSSRETNTGSPQTDTELASTPKRLEDDFFEPPSHVAFTSKAMSVSHNPVNRYRNSVNLTSALGVNKENGSNNTMRSVEARKLIVSNPIRRSISSDPNSMSLSSLRRESMSLPNSPMGEPCSSSCSVPSSSGASTGHPNGRYGTPRRVTREYQQLITAMSTKSPNITAPTTQSNNNLNYDLATKCAWALKLNKEDFLELAPEPAIVEEGENRFTYKELLRRNFAKDYGDLIQTELERYMVEEDFKTVFQKSKSQFYAQVKWRQLEQKKRALLF